MENCENCLKTVPYSVHELTVSAMERQLKHLFYIILVLIFLFVGTNAAWLYYESQWETVEKCEIMQENDGGYNNYIGNDGDIVNGEADNSEN